MENLSRTQHRFTREPCTIRLGKIMSDVLEIIRNIATDVARGNKDPKALASCIVVLINEIEELKNNIKDYHE